MGRTSSSDISPAHSIGAELLRIANYSDTRRIQKSEGPAINRPDHKVGVWTAGKSSLERAAHGGCRIVTIIGDPQ